MRFVSTSLRTMYSFSSGLSREMSSQTMSRLGTIQYSAPETLRGEHYGEEVDIYSFGILAWEMVTDEIPFEGQAPLKYVTCTISNTHHKRVASDVAYNKIRPVIPPSCPPELAELMSACWKDKPKKRLHFLRAANSHRPPFTVIVQTLEKIIAKYEEEAIGKETLTQHQ